MSLDRARRVDLDFIGTLLGVGADEAPALLNGLIYPSLDDPSEWIAAPAALSGNVREKLTRAVEAARTDPRYSDYVELRGVMPADHSAEQIKARPGARWVPADMVAQFEQETFDVTGVVVDTSVGFGWSRSPPTSDMGG
ncbi:MAG TPA: hypothetical protein VME67_25095 [Mycobacterium sp.]|nr:hypothetical protein [Mycobacterium sp.]HTX97821.1 hypothetical protein [Mycobacterium sp.]